MPVLHVCRAHRGLERVLGPLGLEFQRLLIALKVLGIEPVIGEQPVLLTSELSFQTHKLVLFYF